MEFKMRNAIKAQVIIIIMMMVVIFVFKNIISFCNISVTTQVVIVPGNIAYKVCFSSMHSEFLKIFFQCLMFRGRKMFFDNV